MPRVMTPLSLSEKDRNTHGFGHAVESLPTSPLESRTFTNARPSRGGRDTETEEVLSPLRMRHVFSGGCPSLYESRSAPLVASPSFTGTTSTEFSQIHSTQTLGEIPKVVEVPMSGSSTAMRLDGSRSSGSLQDKHVCVHHQLNFRTDCREAERGDDEALIARHEAERWHDRACRQWEGEKERVRGSHFFDGDAGRDHCDDHCEQGQWMSESRGSGDAAFEFMEIASHYETVQRD